MSVCRSCWFANYVNQEMIYKGEEMNTLRNWYLQRKTIQELKALPDYILEDIGINRYRIEEHVRKHFVPVSKAKRRSIDIRPFLIKPHRIREAV